MDIIEQITDFKESLIDKYIVPMKALMNKYVYTLMKEEK